MIKTKHKIWNNRHTIWLWMTPCCIYWLVQNYRSREILKHWAHCPANADMCSLSFRNWINAASYPGRRVNNEIIFQFVTYYCPRTAFRLFQQVMYATPKSSSVIANSLNGPNIAGVHSYYNHSDRPYLEAITIAHSVLSHRNTHSVLSHRNTRHKHKETFLT